MDSTETVSQLTVEPLAGLRVAIACSGLGAVSRGIETWAADSARALRTAGIDVTLFQGAGASDVPYARVVPAWNRFDSRVHRAVSVLRSVGGWHYGAGSGYQLEQTSFALKLWPRIARRYDIVHVQDPWLGFILDRLQRTGLSRPRVILAHGTEEPAMFLRKFSCLQHLAPNYLDDWSPERPMQQRVFAIPNFVNTDLFKPGDRQSAKRALDLPQDGLIVLCVAAIKKHHKRIDDLVQEFARFAAMCNDTVTLVVAGAREADTDEIIAAGSERLGSRVRFLIGLNRAQMPLLYQAADIFALNSLHEMMPIAVLEALASGLPIACNSTPTLRWMAGMAAHPTDISLELAMAHQLCALLDPVERQQMGAAGRVHAEENFSEAAVTTRIIDMYRDVANRPAAVSLTGITSSDH